MRKSLILLCVFFVQTSVRHLNFCNKKNVNTYREITQKKKLTKFQVTPLTECTLSRTALSPSGSSKTRLRWKSRVSLRAHTLVNWHWSHIGHELHPLTLKIMSKLRVSTENAPFLHTDDHIIYCLFFLYLLF